MLSLKRWLDRSCHSGGFLARISSLGGLAACRSEKDRDSHAREPSLGVLGELQAERFLKKLGYKIIAHGHRQRLGEIDLIALDGGMVVFVEVKTWTTDREGDPSLSVDLSKQRKITRTALVYLKRHRLLNHACRFDVISIVWNGTSDSIPRIRHFRNAFEAAGDGSFFS